MDHEERLKAALADRYQIRREIGSGGMATVYLAQDLKHNRKVAVKVLDPELAQTLGAERFLREIETAANLTHPHILPLHDSGEVDGFLFYVMPYVKGESLRARLAREKQLPVEDAVQITREIADALAHAHHQGFVHRDVKPANILLEAGHALLADFGVAQAVAEADETRLTRTGVSVGTPAYMSPEQTTGERELDGRSDQYALACVLYEMLAGQPPFTGAQVESVARQHLTADPVPVTQRRPKVPVWVEDALVRALEKNPADRFTSATRFAAAISGAGTGTGVHRPVAPDRRTVTLPLPTVLGLALIFVFAVFLSVWSLLKGRGEHGADVSRWVITTAPPGQLAPPYGQAVRDRIRLSPDGTQLVYIGSDAPCHLYLRDLDDTEVKQIPGTEGAHSLFFSPDGEWVAFETKTFAGTGHALKKVRLPDGPVTTLTELPFTASSASGAGTWGVNDTLVFTLSGSGLMKIPASGGSYEPLLPEDTITGMTFMGPHFLPDARALLLTSIDLAGELEIRILAQGAREPRFLMPGWDARYLPTGHLIYAQPDGTVAVVPFDLDGLELSGEPSPIGEDIAPAWRRGDFTFSRNGTFAYIPDRVMAERLVVVDRSGREVGSWDRRGDFFSPRYSGDGNQLAVGADLLAEAMQTSPLGREWRIWVASNGEAPMPLTSGTQGIYPAWSPDDSRLMFSDLSEVAWMAADGSGQVETLLQDEDVDYYFTDWSADGQFVAYFSLDRPYLEDRTAQDLGFFRLLGDRTPQQYLQREGPEYGGKFSPNGRYVAYTSETSGRPEVHVSTFPDPEGGTWRITYEGGQEPVWSKDGRELFYWEAGRFMVLPVETEGEFRKGDPEVLFERWFKRFAYSSNYDVHPDGDRFAMIELPQSEDIIVVLSFFEEIRAMFGR